MSIKYLYYKSNSLKPKAIDKLTLKLSFIALCGYPFFILLSYMWENEFFAYSIFANTTFVLILGFSSLIFTLLSSLSIFGYFPKTFYDYKEFKIHHHTFKSLCMAFKKNCLEITVNITVITLVFFATVSNIKENWLPAIVLIFLSIIISTAFYRILNSRVSKNFDYKKNILIPIVALYGVALFCPNTLIKGIFQHFGIAHKNATIAYSNKIISGEVIFISPTEIFIIPNSSPRIVNAIDRSNVEIIEHN